MKSLKEYISRIGKSRGFGIQSPWAYGFVREVITESYSYYIYDEIEKNWPRAEWKKQKIYFRVRNYIKADELTVFDATECDVKGIEAFLSSVNDCEAFIIENIYSNETTRSVWERIKESSLVGVTFDLYDFAIVFTNREMYKQHYKLNF